MVAARASIQLSSKEYVSHIVALPHAVVAALTDSSILSLPVTLDESVNAVTQVSRPQYDVPMTGLAAMPTAPMAVTSCDAQGHLRIWDLRAKGPQLQLDKLDTNLAVTALGVSNFGEIALGTEAKPDAEILVYDARQIRAAAPVVKYVDSHNDDITDLQFHPSLRHLMLSGSTDGVVNLFDTSIKDEDDAVLEAYNHQASIHRIGFFSDSHEALRRLKLTDARTRTQDRVFALSHMETLTVYPLGDVAAAAAAGTSTVNIDIREDALQDDEKPIEYGDLRTVWNCQYVADYQKQHFLVGSNDEGWARLVPILDSVAQEPIPLEGGHGEEVVRCFDLWPASGACFTGGEDGRVKLWDITGRFDDAAGLVAEAAAKTSTAAGKAEKKHLKRSDPLSKEHKHARKHKHKKATDH